MVSVQNHPFFLKFSSTKRVILLEESISRLFFFKKFNPRVEKNTFFPIGLHIHWRIMLLFINLEHFQWTKHSSKKSILPVWEFFIFVNRSLQAQFIKCEPPGFKHLHGFLVLLKQSWTDKNTWSKKKWDDKPMMLLSYTERSRFFSINQRKNFFCKKKFLKRFSFFFYQKIWKWSFNFNFFFSSEVDFVKKIPR